MVVNPSELRQFLASLGVDAKKSLSQNFLIDANILRKIVQEANVQADDCILEIGPGPGALTDCLLKQGATVIAVEKDRLFASHLDRLEHSKDQLHVFEADILHFPIEETIKKHLKCEKKAKVVANLPYQLTSPILAKLAPMHEILSSVTVMVQEEVARRICAKPNTSDYSSLTVFLQFYSNPQYGFQVSRNCFYPAPNVTSAIVTLQLKAPALDNNQEQFFLLVRTAFQHRRKMLKASIRELYSSEKVMSALTSIGLDPQSRPENLSLDHFLQLFKLLFNT